MSKSLYLEGLLGYQNMLDAVCVTPDGKTLKQVEMRYSRITWGVHRIMMILVCVAAWLTIMRDPWAIPPYVLSVLALGYLFLLKKWFANYQTIAIEKLKSDPKAVAFLKQRDENRPSWPPSSTV